MIRPTSDHEVRGLIEALEGPDSARREAAIARLIIIGARAVGRLVATCEQTPDQETHLAILRVLEASGDERAVLVARRGLERGGDIAIAAVGVLRELLHRREGSAHAEALDLLLTVSAEPGTERRVRAAAAEALGSAPEDIRRAVKVAITSPLSVTDALWQDALDGRLPDDPASVAEIVPARADRAPLTEILKTIENVRSRERDSAGVRREGWRSVRGALHQALAARGSRIAIYDLREALEEATAPLPPSFLTAVQLAGDASCLEPIALAIAHAPAQHEPWRRQLAQSFAVIVKRERMTKKHPAVRRAIAKAPSLARS